MTLWIRFFYPHGFSHINPAIQPLPDCDGAGPAYKLNEKEQGVMP